MPERESTVDEPAPRPDRSPSPAIAPCASSPTSSPFWGVFGANASGKSNLLAALGEMRRAVLDSSARWAAHDELPRHPFAPDAGARTEPNSFEVDLVERGVRWTYGFELGPDRVVGE